MAESTVSAFHTHAPSAPVAQKAVSIAERKARLSGLCRLILSAAGEAVSAADPG
jgi:hypothetical protein